MSNFLNIPLRNLLSRDFRVNNALCRRPPHTFRILCLGDSYVYGFGLPTQDSFPLQLQEILNRYSRSPLCEVINAGRPGLNIYNEWALLRQLNSQLEYDLLIVCLSSDDAHFLSKQELASSNADFENIWQNQMNPGSDVLVYVKGTLEKILSEQQKLHIPVVVAYYEPLGSTIRSSVVEQMCAELEIQFVDLVTPFERFTRSQLRVSPADDHPSSLAHRIAATVLAGAVGPLIAKNGKPDASQIEAELCDRLIVYRKADEQQPFGSALAFRHLDACSEFVSYSPEEKTAINGLRELWNTYLKAVQAFSILRLIRFNLGAINEELFRLEQHFLQLCLGIKNQDDAPVTEISAELARAVENSFTVMDGWQWPPIKRFEFKLGGSRLIEMIDNHFQELSTRFLEQVAALEALRQEVSLVRYNAVLLVKKYESQTFVSEGIQNLFRESSSMIEREMSKLRSVSFSLNDEYPSELIVEVEISASCSASNITLIATYIILQPYTRFYRQSIYVENNVKRQSHRFDIPEGTVGYFTVELKFIHSSSTSYGPEECIKELVLEQGAVQHMYAPGMIIYSPFCKKVK